MGAGLIRGSEQGLQRRTPHLGECQKVEEYPESPHVYRKVVGPFEGHLRCEIFLCAAKGGIYPAGRSGLDELCTAKVCDDKVTGDIDEDVLWFQVSVDDPGPVESFDRQRQLAGIELGRIRIERAISHQMSEKVSSGTEILSRLVRTRAHQVGQHLR